MVQCDQHGQAIHKTNRKIALLCMSVVVAMVGLAFAAVPLYQIFCRVTGYGGTIQQTETDGSIAVIDRLITVRFDANVSPKLHWSFKPKIRFVDLKLGQMATIYYVAKNLSSKPLNGTATFNVTPHAAGAYFNKIECFCFTEQTLKPGEQIEMPVQFFVDPELDKDRDLETVTAITLSYTFYPHDTIIDDEITTQQRFNESSSSPPQPMNAALDIGIQ